METATKADIREILIKIANLQKEVYVLKEHLEDITLSTEDIESLEEAEKDFREGKTISHEEARKKLKL